MIFRFNFLFSLLVLPVLAFSFSGADKSRDLENLALRKFYQGDYVQAAKVWKHLEKKQKISVDTWSAFLFERQDYVAVEKVLKKSLQKEKEAMREISPRWYWLARAQADQGDWAGARQSLEQWKGMHTDPEALRLYAESVEAAGDSLDAHVAWDTAVSAARRSQGSALTYYKAAHFYQQQGLRGMAAVLYRQAEKKDGNFTQVHEALAKIYERQGKIWQVKSRLERAAGFDSKNVFLRQELSRLEKKYPQLKRQARREQKAKDKARFVKPNIRVKALVAPPGTPSIRVGLITNAPSFKFRTGGSVVVYRLRGGKRLKTGIRLVGGNVFDVALRGRQWRILRVSPRGEKYSRVILRFNKALRLELVHPEATFRLFDIASGAGYYWASSEDRYYRGSLEFIAQGVTGVTVVNQVNMEEYLMGVVPAEIPSSWPMEALKAQAIAARTHAWENRGHFRKKGFDLCPTQQCAVYKGVTAETLATNAAVKSTVGQVLENAATSKLLPVFYMSNSGGHTQNPGDAWKWKPDAPSSAIFDGPAENPYADQFPLRPDHLLAWLEARGNWPVESYSQRWGKEKPSNFRWIMQYDADRLSRFVARRHKKIGPLVSVEIMDRSDAGYVKQVRFVGEKGSGVSSSDHIRSAIKGLKSSMFYVETRRDPSGKALEFLFYGGGWGHGVGFCQTGAAGMAEKKTDAAHILIHYFPGGKIRKRY